MNGRRKVARAKWLQMGILHLDRALSAVSCEETEIGDYSFPAHAPQRQWMNKVGALNGGFTNFFKQCISLTEQTKPYQILAWPQVRNLLLPRIPAMKIWRCQFPLGNWPQATTALEMEADRGPPTRN